MSRFVGAFFFRCKLKATRYPMKKLSIAVFFCGAAEPDKVYQAKREGEWTRLSMDAQAPDKATAVVLQFYLSNAPQATVWWDDISLEQIPDPGPRRVTIASINLRPAKTRSAEENVEQFISTVERTVQGKTDIILLPEGITVVGTPKPYTDVAEAIPGPTTARLGDLARRKSSYLVAGIYE